MKKTIYAKLLEVKKQVSYIQKDKESHQYKYASPSAVLSRLNPLLNEQGLILKPEVVEMTTERIYLKPKGADVYVDGKKETKVIDVYETLFRIKMRFTWIDSETGETDVNEWASSGVNGDEKGFGSALTYGSRYFLLQYFNIATDNDDPDSFQTKHMSKAEIQELEKKKINAIIIQIDEAKTVEDLMNIKSSNIAFFDFPEVNDKAKAKYKSIIEANPPSKATQPTPKVEAKTETKEEVKPEPKKEVKAPKVDAEYENAVKKYIDVVGKQPDKKLKTAQLLEEIEAVSVVAKVVDVEEMAIEQQKADDGFIASLNEGNVDSYIKTVTGREWTDSGEFVAWATKSINDLINDPRVQEFKDACNEFYNKNWE